MEAKREFLQQRINKLKELRDSGINPFPNQFKAVHNTEKITDRFAGKSPEEVEKCDEIFIIAGRLLAVRNFGKAAFINICDRKGNIQVYVRKDKIGNDAYQFFKKLDIGDFLGIKGRAFLTHTGEITLMAAELYLLSKSLRPLPEKWHGLQDVETRYRGRNANDAGYSWRCNGPAI
jgi:lysyl-tRNA synthetase class 2